MENEQPAFLTMAKGIYDELDTKLLSRFEEMKKSLETTLAPLLAKAMELTYGERIKALEAELVRVKQLNEHSIALLKSLPTPTIQIPEKSIQVTVVERPKKMEKSIIYGATGRPEKIIETSE